MANEEAQSTEQNQEIQDNRLGTTFIPVLTLPQTVTDKLKKHLDVRLQLSSEAKASLDKAWWSAQNTPAYKSSIERINLSLQRSQVTEQAHARLLDALGPVLSLQKPQEQVERQPDTEEDLEPTVSKPSPAQSTAIEEVAVQLVEALEEDLGEEQLDAQADEFSAQNPAVLEQVERLGILDHLDNNPKRRKRVAFLLGLYISILCTFGLLTVTENLSPDTQKLISASGFGGLTVGGATTVGTNKYFDKRAKRNEEQDKGAREDEPQ